MHIVVVDLKKHRRATAIAGICVVLLVLLSVAISTVTKIMSEELFLRAATEGYDKKIVIIDPGHGGEDCGAIGKGGVLEKEVNLGIALEMGERLAERGYAVIFTRTEDRLLYSPEENIKGLRKISDLKNRCKVASEYPDALFVSIHTNSFGDSRYSGLQVYYSDSEGSERLATLIQNEVRDTLQNENHRKIKRAESMYVLENTENTAVLIECGFLSNAEECKKLSEKEYQKQLSFSIVCGIIKYIEENEGQ